MRYTRFCDDQVFARKGFYLQKPEKAYRHKQLPITTPRLRSGQDYQLPITNYQLADILHLSEKGYMCNTLLV